VTSFAARLVQAHLSPSLSGIVTRPGADMPSIDADWPACLTMSRPISKAI
jgi:hypothetical protein